MNSMSESVARGEKRGARPTKTPEKCISEEDEDDTRSRDRRKDRLGPHYISPLVHGIFSSYFVSPVGNASSMPLRAR